MLKVLFFGQLADVLACQSMTMPQQRIRTMHDLLDILKARDPRWSDALADRTLMMAVNHTLVDPHHPLAEGDEVAFFPPVTGG